jgi:SRSO17 transposase
MLPLKRKSIEPLAAAMDPLHVAAKHQSLHHFVAKSNWSDSALLREVRTVVEPVLGLERSATGSLTTRESPNKGNIRSASPGNTAGSWARRRTVRWR